MSTKAGALLLVAVASLGCGGGGAAHEEAASSAGVGGASSSTSVGAGGEPAANSGSSSSSVSSSSGGDGGLVVFGCDASAAPTRSISCVLAFEPGAGAGFGQSDFPDIIYGPPIGGGTTQGSTDVLSLGGGGTIAFGFGGNAIVDGPGPDFIIFENPFDVGGDATDPYAEPGVVSVSDDGVTWIDFPCAPGAYPYTGCAGWHPVLSSPSNGVSPLDPATAGGDAFDLADIGVTHARFVRIRDVSFKGAPPTEGFDLDAAAIVNAASP